MHVDSLTLKVKVPTTEGRLAMERVEDDNSNICTICGAEGMQIKTMVLTYQEPGKEEVELEIQGEVCDQCDEIVLKDVI